MATVTYVQDDQTVDYTPSSAVSAGDVIVQVDLVGVAVNDIAANALGSLAVRGIFDFPKASGSGSAIPVGTTVYWDESEDEAVADADSGTNKRIGPAVATAANAATTVRALLIP